MDYRLKAIAHAIFGTLPYGYLIYQMFQKKMGGLKNPDFINRFNINAKIINTLCKANCDIHESHIMEVGTGRILTSPVGFFLSGASRIDTYDVTYFMDKKLASTMLYWIRRNKDSLKQIYGNNFSESRYQILCQLENLDQLLTECNIYYHSPSDASKINFPSDTFDIHVSQNTLEHIPVPVLCEIMEEASRVVKPDGFIAHIIDHTDHWAKSDPKVCSAHFLKYSETLWHLIAGNKYAFLNRLRSCEIIRIFKTSKLEICSTYVEKDEDAALWLKELKNLPKRFSNMNYDELAIASTLLVAKPSLKQ